MGPLAESRNLKKAIRWIFWAREPVRREAEDNFPGGSGGDPGRPFFGNPKSKNSRVLERFPGGSSGGPLVIPNRWIHERCGSSGHSRMVPERAIGRAPGGSFWHSQIEVFSFGFECGRAGPRRDCKEPIRGINQNSKVLGLSPATPSAPRK